MTSAKSLCVCRRKVALRGDACLLTAAGRLALPELNYHSLALTEALPEAHHKGCNSCEMVTTRKPITKNTLNKPFTCGTYSFLLTVHH